MSAQGSLNLAGLKWHGMSFLPDMVRAIRLDLKTETRRIVHGWESFCGSCWRAAVPHNGEEAAFGGPCYLRIPACNGEDGAHSGDRIRPPWDIGDRIWVRESWFPKRSGEVLYHEDIWPALVATDGERVAWRPARNMPRELSRFRLEVLDVGAEALQSITDEGALAEGIPAPLLRAASSPREAFARLWNSIHGRSVGCKWADNPWVWVVRFGRLP